MTSQRVVKVFVAIPNMGYTDPAAYDNRILWGMRMGAESEAAKHDGRPIRYEFYLGTVGKLLTPYAREVLAEKAVNAKMDLIFFVDDDMLGGPEVFFQLAENIVNGPADVCAALAFTRNPPHDPVIYTCIDGRDPIDGTYFRNTVLKRYPRNKLVECDAVGFGAVVFKVDLLRRMKQPWFMSTCGSGEDVFWCYKAKREAGARIFSDTRVKLGHVGNAEIVTEETFDRHQGMQEKLEHDGEQERTVGLQPWQVMR